MSASLVLHAHCYQPPREDPFLDEIEREPSASPYHDWNQRIERECYRALVAARIPAADGRIARVINTLEYISFNVGPTLFEWMESHAPGTHHQMLAADRASCERLGGHGNAIAHPYHHVILPLASRRDKVTEVRWGITDFRRRFGRDPEGMWLPETAVDDETLDVLAQEGMRFTILAPHQVETAPPSGLPGTYRTSSGREIALCLYDGDLSHGIAFGGLVRDAGLWWNAIERSAGRGAKAEGGRRRSPKGTPAVGQVAPPSATAARLVSAATDGETYGHHHRFAEMALAAVLERARSAGYSLENFASFVARHPPVHEVTLVAPSAWSCAHGVERWRSDCGCRLDGGANPSQAWRTPLRVGLNALADHLHHVFEDEGARWFRDPWAAREGFGGVLSLPPDARIAFVRGMLREARGDSSRPLELLEMERDALRMFTSCAWFFDDVAGIEVGQVLRYAIRAASLAADGEGIPLLVRHLRGARSNRPAPGSGADILLALPRSDVVEARVAAAAWTLGLLGLDAGTELPPEFGVLVDGDRIMLMSRRTGRRVALDVARFDRTAADVRLEVRHLEAGTTHHVAVTDFPERARHAVRRRFREDLLPRCLTPPELAQLASGEASLPAVAGVALTRSIERAGSLQGAETALAMMDLFEQLETTVPFDAQTAFWRLWTAPDQTPTDPLRALGRRLGFTLDPDTPDR